MTANLTPTQVDAIPQSLYKFAPGSYSRNLSIRNQSHVAVRQPIYLTFLAGVLLPKGAKEKDRSILATLLNQPSQ
jgi:hypothetical protein